MRVLVTGGAGFIGSHLVDRLLMDGHHVIVIDDLSEGKLTNLPMAHPELEVYRDTILNDVGRCFRRVELVYHLAALPRPQRSIDEPLPAHHVNVTGTLNVLEYCRRHGVKRVVFASSASLYGENRYPSWEHYQPNPMCPYALHKWIGEGYCRLYGDLFGLEWVALRFFNVYGPRMNPWGEYASVIPKFIELVKYGHRPCIYGTGEQARDFVHVWDVVEGLVLAGYSPNTNEVYNIGSGVNYSVNKVLEIICGCLGVEVEPEYAPALVEPAQTLAANKKALWSLYWQPSITLEEGIEKLCQA